MISEDHLRLSLLRYFAADMTADERALFEERLLTDEEFSDAVAVQEQDLIDAYALGALTAEEMRSIQTWIESSPRRMQRVRMARAFLVKRPQKIRRKQYATIMLAAAACILAAVGITPSLISKLMRQNSERVSSGTIAAVQNGRPQTSPGNTAKPEVILLVADRIRGRQHITTYRVPPGVTVQVQVLLAGASASSDYTLQIVSHDAKPHIVLEQRRLRAQVKEGQPYIEGTFPPGSLPPANYRAFVSRGGDTLIADFAVR